MSTLLLGDVLESLSPADLDLAPSIAPGGTGAGLQSRVGGAPSNQAILDATKAFYGAHQPVVDTSATNAGSVAQHQPGYVGSMNGYSWKNQQLGAAEQATTGAALFGTTDRGLFDPDLSRTADESASRPATLAAATGGIFDDTLDQVKADQLFSTIGLGINADVQFFVGGAGGLGCMWDIAKREGPKGYGFATAQVGLRINASLNVQVLVTNQLPSATNFDIYGLTVSVAYGISLAFSVFYVGTELTLLGYGIGAGIGLGGGATVFGGHVWNFG